jgi:hypothetical protein
MLPIPGAEEKEREPSRFANGWKGEVEEGCI